MNLDFSRLSYENLGSWPLQIKCIFVVVLFIAVVLVGYGFDIRHQSAQLEKARRQEIVLKDQYKNIYHEVANIQAYRQQMRVIKKQFDDLVHQLPNRTQVPELLEDISKTGVANGLEFQLFKPLPEVPREFYVELPIKIRVGGTYAQLAKFISDVAQLERIVTFDDFEIQNVKDPEEDKGKTLGGNTPENVAPRSILWMDIMAKTYRYTE